MDRDSLSSQSPARGAGSDRNPIPRSRPEPGAATCEWHCVKPRARKFRATDYVFAAFLAALAVIPAIALHTLPIAQASSWHQRNLGECSTLQSADFDHSIAYYDSLGIPMPDALVTDLRAALNTR